MIHYWGNIIEGAFWIAIAGIIYIRMQTMSKERQQIGKLAMPAFLLFGISDFIEVNTGAWYEPIWLLLMKAVCVITFLYCLMKYISLSKNSPG